MKLFAFLNCFSAVLANYNDASGQLVFTVSNGVLNVQGNLAGLPASMRNAGIHVHTGTQCNEPTQIGGMLQSSSLDGWLITKYGSDSSGTAQINTRTKGYVIASSDAIDGLSYVEGRCIVLHGLGLTSASLASRAATGKIVPDGQGGYYADIGPYPGQTEFAQIVGRIGVTVNKNKEMIFEGVIAGLAPNLRDAGIHVHTGFDCTSHQAIGGHLLYQGDGFVQTYETDAQGAASINIDTSKGAYTLAAVDGRCIVAHSMSMDTNTGSMKMGNVAVGKIDCQAGTQCTANMQPYPQPVVPIAGTLQVTNDGGSVVLQGVIYGLPRSSTSGIHVHTSTDCSNNGAKTDIGILTHMGGHLFSDAVDGWAFPVPITYNTDENGAANIDVTAGTHYLDNDDYADEDVKGRCIVLHGASTEKMSDRVAVGKIQKTNGGWSASINLYPGPNALKDLGSTPSGELVVTASGGFVNLKGTLTGLGKNLRGAGIHVHTGTDCTGGSVGTKEAVNAVIGGHLLSRGDGFQDSTYTSNVNGEAQVNIRLPKNAYALTDAEALGTKKSSVENRCIVVHEGNINRVGIGQILCSLGVCTAQIKAYPKPVGDLAGELAVTYDSNSQVLSIKGPLTGLPRAVTGAGIHVHSGMDCTDKDAIGGHLYTNTIDGWAYPTQIVYDTSATGEANIDVTAKSHTLSVSDNTVPKPSVEGRCIVLHGVTPQSLSPRVAVGKIEKVGEGYIATIKKYPLSSAKHADGQLLEPAGALAVIQEGTDGVKLVGTVTGLGKNLIGAGIHIHTGTDCTAAGATTSSGVNGIIGGHLLSRGDGYLKTVYNSDNYRDGTIDISTPKGSYVLRAADTTTDGASYVNGRCIVIHDDKKARVGVGKIICGDMGCTATMGPYPTDTTTPKPQPTDPATNPPAPVDPVNPVQPAEPDTPTVTKSSQVQDDGEPEVSGVTTILMTLSATVFYCIFAF